MYTCDSVRTLASGYRVLLFSILSLTLLFQLHDLYGCIISVFFPQSSNRASNINSNVYKDLRHNLNLSL
jgi:hypothetical protein